MNLQAIHRPCKFILITAAAGIFSVFFPGHHLKVSMEFSKTAFLFFDCFLLIFRCRIKSSVFHSAIRNYKKDDHPCADKYLLLSHYLLCETCRGHFLVPSYYQEARISFCNYPRSIALRPGLLPGWQWSAVSDKVKIYVS